MAAITGHDGLTDEPIGRCQERTRLAEALFEAPVADDKARAAGRASRWARV
ncbi:hypothetical protein Afil01_56110 [Actinorhabdospora filicis]|uniref:Uncharacterized protein n=1 Tax=Actinorhabdospora filicis TaxID=1785913 RepID=A0A9W6SPX8_9ACTN|nr:hypothetical protein [Actinorhabdospora filicis]GLZ80804.1 hypothetical protein Afil01_56110 [Actinorhabdospora filicis]